MAMTKEEEEEVVQMTFHIFLVSTLVKVKLICTFK